MIVLLRLNPQRQAPLRARRKRRAPQRLRHQMARRRPRQRVALVVRVARRHLGEVETEVEAIRLREVVPRAAHRNRQARLWMAPSRRQKVNGITP